MDRENRISREEQAEGKGEKLTSLYQTVHRDYQSHITQAEITTGPLAQMQELVEDLRQALTVQHCCISEVKWHGRGHTVTLVDSRASNYLVFPNCTPLEVYLPFIQQGLKLRRERPSESQPYVLINDFISFQRNSPDVTWPNQIRSAAFVPILIGQEFRGVIACKDLSPRIWTEREGRLLCIIAKQVRVALGNYYDIYTSGNPHTASTHNVSSVSKEVALTVKEKEMLGLVVQGYPNKEIAQQLFVCLRTVETHITSLLKKTHLENRTQLTLWAIQHNRL